jgi:Rrf2 family protein
MIEIAKRYGAGPVKRKDIAQTQGLTEGYLEAILGSLRGGHFVKTVRGAGGGFTLEKPPSGITLLDIVLALEGSISPVECVENPQVCERAVSCAARTAWVKLYEAERSALGSITLQDLVEKEQQAHSNSYAI